LFFLLRKEKKKKKEKGLKVTYGNPPDVGSAMKGANLNV